MEELLESILGKGAEGKNEMQVDLFLLLVKNVELDMWKEGEEEM